MGDKYLEQLMSPSLSSTFKGYYSSGKNEGTNKRKYPKINEKFVVNQNYVARGGNPRAGISREDCVNYTIDHDNLLITNYFKTPF